MTPLFSRSKPCIIAFHVGDCEGNAVSRRSPFGKYLAFISFAHKLSGYSMSRHACFASRAWLKTWKSRNPNPPLDLHRVNLSQAIQCVLLLLSSSPHQYLRTPRASSSQKDAERWKTLIVYVGIAWATALICTSFAAAERCFSDHIAIRLPIRSLRGWKRSFFCLPSGVGRPRYFASNSILSTSKTALISSFLSVSSDSRHNREHFAGLRSCPVPLSNREMRFLTFVACSTFALKNKRASSTPILCPYFHHPS